MRSVKKHRSARLVTRAQRIPFMMYEMAEEYIGMRWIAQRIKDYSRTCHYFYLEQWGKKLDETYHELMKIIQTEEKRESFFKKSHRLRKESLTQKGELCAEQKNNVLRN